MSDRAGRTVIENPRAGVTVRNAGGDIRLLAMTGVGGNFDLQAEQGDVRALLPRDASVALTVQAQNGLVRTAVPLTGTVGPETQALQAMLNGGAYRVALSATDGDVTID